MNNASNNEECYYGDQVYYCNYCTDCLNARHCEVCYEVTDSKECRFVRHSANCLDCRDSLYLYACRSCHHCAGCVNLVNAEYHILNKPVAREEYEVFMRDFWTNGTKRREFVAAFEKLKRESVRKYANITESERSIGNNLKNAKNCVGVFDASEVENVRHSTESGGSRDCMDMDVWGDTAELVYETHCTGGGVSGVLFSNIVWGPLTNIYYSDNCVSGCSDIFGCVSLQNKKYCILNKQYTESEYNELVPRIIAHMRETGEWGEFFPSSMSPFGYNETIAMEYFPLSREEALARGFRWSDYEAPFPKVDKTLPASKLPENIADIPDDILNWAIECEVTRKPFRITRQELEFYRKHGLPIPRRHPERRHLDRLAQRDPRTLHERTCDSCSKDIVSVYSPDRPERVYCEECYHREVYG